jgi:hypothetical protein
MVLTGFRIPVNIPMYSHFLLDSLINRLEELLLLELLLAVILRVDLWL